jgi:hypothetical protein
VPAAAFRYQEAPWTLRLLQALAWLGLAIWMVILYRRYARRQVPIGSPASDL